MRSIIFSAGALLLVLGCGDKNGKHGGDGGGGGDPGRDPCAGAGCGDACTLCDPADPDCVETAVVKACDANGACVPAQAGMCGQQCTYNGATYEPGDSFPAGDGCNSCSCTEDGTVACTLIACPVQCGGIDGVACEPGEYCHYAIGTCGAADVPGVCETMPVLCPNIYEPVCACDDKTFANACQAAAEGKSLVHEGACEE